MKKTVMMAVLCFLLVTGLLQASDAPDSIRTGIGALQFVPDMPEYIRYFQLSNSDRDVQWACIEPEQGVYDFSIIEEKLKEIKEMDRNAIIKLNANRKPDWLWDIVPYVTDRGRGTQPLMYWHPNFIEAYENLLIAYGKYLEQTPYRDIITGIRMNFNAIGTEMTVVAARHRPLEVWTIPEGVDPETVEPYTDEIPDQYKEIVVGLFIEHILPYAYVWARQGIPDATLEKYRDYFETGRMGFFQTGSAMEQNQIYPVSTRYSRFIEWCRSGKTMGFTEVDGYHNYTGRYDPDSPRYDPRREYGLEDVFEITQFNYWRMLSEMHCGVSMAGTHLHMFQGRLEEDGPVLNFFEVPEMDATFRFTDKYIGLHASPKATPGAWVALRDDTGDMYQGDYTFLMEREGNNPIWPLEDNFPGVDDGSIGLRSVGSDLVRFGAWARALPPGRTMTFHVDPRVFSEGERRIARVVYFDEGQGTWELKQDGEVKLSVNNTDTGEWIELEVLITTDGDVYELASTGTENVIFHMLEVKRVNHL